MYSKDFSLKNMSKRVFELLRNAGADLSIKDFSGKILEDYVTADEARYLGL